MSDLSPEGKEKSEAPSTCDANATKHYQWPPARDPNLGYKNKTRNPVHAIIIALPTIMLTVGLFIYYSGESRQTHSATLFDRSTESSGVFTGLSETRGRHYLWLEIDGVAKGMRVQAKQVPQLEGLVRDSPVKLKIAPHVENSTTYWAWYVEQSGKVFIDEQDSSR